SPWLEIPNKFTVVRSTVKMSQELEGLHLRQSNSENHKRGNFMIRNKIPVLIVALGLIVFVAGCSKPTGNQNASANANVSTTNLKEEPKMKELDHDNLEYQGSPGEKVTIRITAQGTTHMDTYKLDGGETQVLKQGDPIEFDLKNVSGQRTEQEVNIDGDH